MTTDVVLLPDDIELVLGEDGGLASDGVREVNGVSIENDSSAAFLSAYICPAMSRQTVT